MFDILNGKQILFVAQRVIFNRLAFVVNKTCYKVAQALSVYNRRTKDVFAFFKR